MHKMRELLSLKQLKRVPGYMSQVDPPSTVVTGDKLRSALLDPTFCAAFCPLLSGAKEGTAAVEGTGDATAGAMTGTLAGGIAAMLYLQDIAIWGSTGDCDSLSPVVVTKVRHLQVTY